MDIPLPRSPYQSTPGRGALSSPPVRFETLAHSPIDAETQDDWTVDTTSAPKLATHLHTDTSRSVVNAITSPDLGYARSLNPYRGCEHGCIYCYARPSHAYLGYSAGLDFETEIFHKPDAPELLRREFSAKSYRPMPILLGSNTDCYQPLERDLRLTRALVDVFAQTLHPLMITTKSALVVRDIDLLAPMAAQNLVQVNVSVTTLDPTLARAMEPRASAPYKRLKAIESLAKAGIPVMVLAAPMIPGLNDQELERILQSAYDAGARRADYILVRLPYELKSLFMEWLKANYPERADHVISLIRETRNGKLYDADFAKRMTGEGAYADLLAQRFALAEKQIGFSRKALALRTDLFQPPSAGGEQLRLFG